MRASLTSCVGVILVVALTISMPFTFACAAVLRVPSEFLLIQEAVSAASEGDTVLVASGTYTGAGNKDIDFTGVNMVVLGEAGAGSTIIDCEGSGRGFNFHSGENHESVVRGFTIARGHVWSRDGGGAIRCYESSPTIQECVFEECMGLSGGAVLAERSSLIVEDCAFLACVGGEGGAICLYWPQGAIVERCWFEGCHSEATLVNYGGRVEIRDCAIVDNYNSAVSTWFSFAVSEVERCTIVRNYGYALHSVYGGSTTARNCIIAFNGSATHCYQSMPLASHCAVFENTSSDSLCGNAIENLLTDPLFCDPSLDELALCADSPCLAGGNPWGEQIGAFGEGCPPCATPVARESWGCIKSLYR